MTLVKILKRKDASSIIVAILVALIISQPLSELLSTPAAKLLSLKAGQYVGYAPPNSGARYYVYYVVWALLQLVVLEILAWLWVQSAAMSKKK